MWGRAGSAKIRAREAEESQSLIFKFQLQDHLVMVTVSSMAQLEAHRAHIAMSVW